MPPFFWVCVDFLRSVLIGDPQLLESSSPLLRLEWVGLKSTDREDPRRAFEDVSSSGAVRKLKWTLREAGQKNSSFLVRARPQSRLPTKSNVWRRVLGCFERSAVSCSSSMPVHLPGKLVEWVESVFSEFLIVDLPCQG